MRLRRFGLLALLVLAPSGAVAPAAGAAPSGDIFVADFNAFADGGGGVIRVDPVTGARSTVSSNASPATGPSFADPAGMALAPGGDLLVADMNAFGGPGGVIRVNPVTGARSTVSANLAPLGGPSFEDPSGIVLDRSGDLLIADRGAFGGTGAIIRVDIETGQRTPISHNAAPGGGPSFVEPVGVAPGPSGEVFVTDEDAFGDSSGGVIRVDPVSGTRTTLSDNTTPPGGPGFVEPVGLLRAPEGHLLVVEEDGFADAAGGVIRVDPVTGARSTLSANGAPAGGPSFKQPYGAALAPDGGLLVADFDAFGDLGGGVIRVDRASGTRRTVSANAAPVGGPSFVDPVAIVMEPVAGAATPPRPTPPPAPARADAVAPVIRSASVRPRTFAVAPRTRRLGSRAAPRGTSFRFGVSEPARVTFTIEQQSRGRRAGGRCRRSTRAYRRRPPCTLRRRAGSLAHRVAAGRSRKRFSGRIGRRALRAGRYRVVLRATDAAGNRSRVRHLAFRVVD